MKNIVITGSTRGIGLCMAREFLKTGCNVTISGRNENTYERLREDFAEYSDRIQYVSCDVRSIEQIEKLWEAAAARWGSVDCWINNAGQNSPYEYAYNTGKNYVDKVIDTNIRGIIYGSQVAAKKMLAQGVGQIWNMEGLGSNDMIQPKTILYGTTKHALTYFTKGLAMELKGTKVLAGRLSPGMMLTEFITRTPDGEKSPVLNNVSFSKIFNILGDRPETVAAFFIPRILENKKNNAHIVWLTNTKAAYRFATAAFRKRKLI